MLTPFEILTIADNSVYSDSIIEIVPKPSVNNNLW